MNLNQLFCSSNAEAVSLNSPSEEETQTSIEIMQSYLEAILTQEKPFLASSPVVYKYGEDLKIKDNDTEKDE